MKQNSKLPEKSWLSVKTEIDNPYFDRLLIVLQDCLDKILQNDNYRERLAQITTVKMSPKTGRYIKKLKGDYQKEIKAITGNPLKNKIYQGGNFFNYVCDNIIHLILSHHEQVEIYNCLKQNNYKINDNLYQLVDNNREISNYPSRFYLKTLVRAKKVPDLPKHKRFIMDFSVDNHQGFSMDSNLKCTLHVAKTNKPTKKQRQQGLTHGLFKDSIVSNVIPKDVVFQLYLPPYIRAELMTGKIAKPIVYYDQQCHETVCQIAYEINIPDRSDFTNVLGVDLGKVKLFSAVALFENDTFSPEYVPSNQLQQLANKADRLRTHKEIVMAKIERSENYNDVFLAKTNRQRRRETDYYFAKHKLTRLKSEIVKLAAEEIVAIAIKYRCKEIHLENLHWLLALGGKWNYNDLQKRIKAVALMLGIKVINVNCKNTSKRHPFTGELGQAVNRNIIFDDGTSFDRDHLAAMNIALTKGGSNKKQRKARLKSNTTTHIKRVNRKRQIREQLKLAFKQLGRTMQIVMFSFKQDKLSLEQIKSENSGLCNNIATKGFQRFDRYQNLSFRCIL